MSEGQFAVRLLTWWKRILFQDDLGLLVFLGLMVFLGVTLGTDVVINDSYAITTRCCR